MTAYAVGHIRNIAMEPDIAEYLSRIDATLAPFGGRFRIHGGDRLDLEGGFSGDLVVVEFADRERVLAWYRSPAYRRILPLRTANAESDVFIIDGVGDDHRATDVLAR